LRQQPSRRGLTKLIETLEFLAKREYFLLKVTKDEALDFAGMFQNNHQVYLEIGSGKGEFITEYPLLHPEWNFIGFELKPKRVDIILRKLDLEKHLNVRVATFRIDRDIEKFIAPQTVAGVFIQHPDPWPKRRHFKRRLVQQDFLDALAKIIQPGGFIQVSTDHAEYAQWIWKQFLKRQDYVPKVSEAISPKPLLDEHIVTYYEREQRRLGFEPQHMLFEKR
jgi:tRNA (guanine-N7-)-methyltransferase